MESIGRLLLIGGFTIAILTQLYIVFLSFKIRFSAGFFCLIITPIYAFVSEDLRNNKKIKPALKVWLLGFGMCLSSVFLL